MSLRIASTKRQKLHMPVMKVYSYTSTVRTVDNRKFEVAMFIIKILY